MYIYIDIFIHAYTFAPLWVVKHLALQAEASMIDYNNLDG